MKKIVIITPWYNCFSGGAEVLARKLAEESVRRGISVEVLTTTVTSPYDSWWEDGVKPGQETINGVVVKRFAVNTYGKDNYQKAISKQVNRQKLSDADKEAFFKFGINSDSLTNYVSELNNDTFIVVLPYFQALAYNVILKNPNKVSFIPCFHNENQFFWQQTKKMIDHCKQVFFLSEPEKEMTIHQYGLTFGKKVIEAPVIGAGVEPTKNEKYVKGLPEQYILYVGRKDIGKGVRELVNFHKNLKPVIPLVFVGGGDKKLVPENANFIDFGFVDEEEKNFIIKNASCLVNYSPNESFSFVIMEAWLHEVPVIVNKACHVTHYHVQQSGGGYSIQSMEEYQQAIKHIIGNSHHAAELGKNGKEYVLRKYSWDAVIENLIAGEINA